MYLYQYIYIYINFQQFPSADKIPEVKYGLDFKLDYEAGDQVIERLWKNLSEKEPGNIMEKEILKFFSVILTQDTYSYHERVQTLYFIDNILFCDELTLIGRVSGCCSNAGGG